MADIKGHQALDNYIPHKINMYLFLFSILLYISNFKEKCEKQHSHQSVYITSDNCDNGDNSDNGDDSDKSDNCENGDNLWQRRQQWQRWQL